MSESFDIVEKIDQELATLGEVLDEPESENSPLKELVESVLSWLSNLRLDKRELVAYLQELQKISAQSREKRDYDFQVVLLLANILKVLYKEELFFKLLEVVVAQKGKWLSNDDQEKKIALQTVLPYYKKVLASKQKNESKQGINKNLVQEIEQIFNSKLHEINIKIEENQRILHNLLKAKERELQEKESNIEDYFSEFEIFLKFRINQHSYVIKNDLVLYRCSVSAKKALKLLSKNAVLFKELLGNSLLGGFKYQELKILDPFKNVSFKEIKELVLYPLKIESSNNFKIALIVEIQTDKYGIIFVDKVDNLVQDGIISGKNLKVGDELFKIIEPKELWAQMQGELE